MGIWERLRRSAPAADKPRVEPVMRRPRSIGRRSYFTAAEKSPLLADWREHFSSFNDILFSDLRTVRARSRSLTANSDYAKAFIRLLQTNVIGPDGIGLEGRPRDRNGELDKADKARLEAAWKQWGKKGVCTADGRLSWCDVQRLVIRLLVRDGEVFIRKRLGFGGNEFRYALQFIEPERIDTQHFADLPNGNKIRMGIEVNADGRPIAYHILTAHPHDPRVAPGLRTARVEAKEIVHIFVAEDANQIRGLPWMVTAARKLHMLGGYEFAELTAARTAAAKMGFLEENPEAGDVAGEPIEDDDVDGDHYMDADAGSVWRLPSGYEFKPWDPQHPTQAFPFFVKAMLRGVSAGFGVGYNNLAQDGEGINFSTMRGFSLEERAFYRTLQNFAVEHLCDTIYDDWLSFAITSGRLDVPMTAFDKFAEIRWRPRGWTWVDPAKEVAASKEEINLGLTSRRRVAASRGINFDDVVEELGEEQELAAAAGVDVSGAKASAPAPAPAPAQPQEDDDQ